MNEILRDRVAFVLVEPIYNGNIGSSARVIKNFGFNNLILINPPKITDDAINLASHAVDILKNAKIYSSLDEISKEYNIIIGTTGIVAKNKYNFNRNPIFYPEDLKNKLNKFDKSSKIAILFGRENFGLKIDELNICNLICSIPTSKAYSILNLSQSVGIIAYELSKIKNVILLNSISLLESKRLLETINELLDDIDYDKIKKKNILSMFRKINGRICLAECEYKTILGLIREIQYPIKKYNKT